MPSRPQRSSRALLYRPTARYIHVDGLNVIYTISPAERIVLFLIASNNNFGGAVMLERLPSEETPASALVSLFNRSAWLVG